MSTLVGLHLGALHPVEQAATLLLAFGPFVVLGVVVVLRRRADERAVAEEPAAEQPASEEPASVEPAGPVPPQRER